MFNYGVCLVLEYISVFRYTRRRWTKYPMPYPEEIMWKLKSMGWKEFPKKIKKNTNGRKWAKVLFFHFRYKNIQGLFVFEKDKVYYMGIHFEIKTQLCL